MVSLKVDLGWPTVEAVLDECFDDDRMRWTMHQWQALIVDLNAHISSTGLLWAS